MKISVAAAPSPVARSEGNGSVEPLILVVPVWGRTHVATFLDIALPSWFAPGNLPYLADRWRLSVRIVTRAEDRATITQSAPFRALAALAAVELIELDDLLAPVGVYLTLTLAFHRGLSHAMQGAGPAVGMLLDADFVLASGSLETLHRALAGGATSVLAPSLRGVKETLTGVLIDRRETESLLSVGARDLVSLALDAAHPTLSAARMDQAILHSSGGHLLVWRPEPQTLVGRGFCLFPLAVRLGSPPPPAESFCDHGLIPVLSGEAAPVILDDSDGFFALELAPQTHEASFLRLGAPTPAGVAAGVGAWSNQFHRDQAKTALFFRAGEPGPRVTDAVAASQGFIEAALASMKPVQPVRNPPQWLAVAREWVRSRTELGIEHDPPELAPVPPPPPAAEGVRRLARALLVGRPAGSRVWHPRWVLARSLARYARDADVAGRPIRPCGAWLFDDMVPVPSTAAAPRGALLIGVPAQEPQRRSALLTGAQAMLDDAETAAVLILAEPGKTVDVESIAAAVAWLETRMAVTRIQSFDLRADDRVRLAHGRLADGFEAASVLEKMIGVRASAVALLAMGGVNLTRMAFGPAVSPRFVSAALIEASLRDTPA